MDEFEQRDFMVRAELDEADPIWGSVARVYDTYRGGWIVESSRSGNYSCPRDLRGYISEWPPEARARLTTWITDQNRSGTRYPRVTADVVEKVFSARPLRYRSKVDRLFLLLNHRGYRPGDTVVPRGGLETPEMIASRGEILRWIEGKSDSEFYGLIAALSQDGTLNNDGGAITLGPLGLQRLDDMSASGASNDQAFVAMWFSPDMESVYQEGFTVGLSDAGYRAFRIDQKEHSNKIDDEIISEIRRSRFLVADFTCGVIGTPPVGVPRGGVYYEAGFAQGLGMQVIWTVRHDQIELVHFDTRQFNHIVWTDAADLRVKLRNRVGAVIGDYGSGAS